MGEDVTGLPGGWLPLWPFQTLDQVESWQAHRRAAGADPQHRLDATATALEFTRGVLGFTAVDRGSASGSGSAAVVAVGWEPEPGLALTVATLNLARFGPGEAAPWVVTGSNDAGAFSSPGYGDAVRPPLRLGGRMTGADEALRARVTGPGGRVLGSAGPVTVGGTDQPWALTVPLPELPGGTILTVTVSTGGHLGDVEWFAVTAVRVA